MPDFTVIIEAWDSESEFGAERRSYAIGVPNPHDRWATVHVAQQALERFSREFHHREPPDPDLLDLRVIPNDGWAGKASTQNDSPGRGDDDD